MKFCRNCGASLAHTTPGSPAFAPAVGAPMMGSPPMGVPYGAPSPPTKPPAAAPLVSSGGPRLSPQGSTITCPRCGTSTPVGFAYCQQCGLHLNAIAPTDPGAVGARPPSSGGSTNANVDAQAATIASDGVRAGSIVPPVARERPPSAPPVVPLASVQQAPRPAGAPWGTAILVNRDGTDGQRFPLSSEDTVVGRAGADIAFNDDRFLARQHARIERASDGTVKIHPIDTTNGVFKKTEGSVELADGAVILVGREVLRFERVGQEERTVHPLVRHGVALFGSPPREPWGRMLQLIPSGGFRDVRHLMGDEVVLGREEGDIVFRDDAFMSRRHAAITWDGRRAMLTDLGSSNGTFVRIAGPTVIKHGDHVRLGDQLLRIER